MSHLSWHRIQQLGAARRRSQDKEEKKKEKTGNSGELMRRPRNYKSTSPSASELFKMSDSLNCLAIMRLGVMCDSILAPMVRFNYILIKRYIRGKKTIKEA